MIHGKSLLSLMMFLFSFLQGSECCSQYVVSFHHMDVYSIAVLHHLLYRTSVYGLRQPKKVQKMFSVERRPRQERYIIP